MDESTIKLIKSSKIFSSLNAHTYQKILPKFEKIELNKDEILFSQGDTAKYLYILLNGKLAVYVSPAYMAHKVVTYIEPGETIGEMSLLSNEPRSFTVIAAKHSCLLRLPKKIFTTICKQYPEIMVTMLERSQETIRIFTTEKFKRHIIIIAAHPTISLNDFSIQLCRQTKKLATVIFLSDYAMEGDTNKKTQSELQEIITEIEKSRAPKRRIIYLLKSTETTLAKICLKKADSIYIAAHHDSDVKIDSKIIAKIKLRKKHLCTDPGLILLYPANTELPKNTRRWFGLMDFSMHHHIRQSNLSDHLRLLRFIRNCAVGLVLGGGGTRGWAHIGAIKALQEAKIPIDIIGGTSVGGIIGALYAMHSTHKEIYKQFDEIVMGSGKTVAWKNITWPYISLFDAKGFTLSQENAFGDIHLEDLWIPFFCISSNLSLQREEVHRTGLLWEIIRCSTSIPGLVPPMILNGEIHFDGGLVNNLPVDVMRRQLGKISKIIAIELVRDNGHEIKYHFPPILTLSEAILTKIGLGGKKYKYPPFIDTILKAFLMGSIVKAKQSAPIANLFINMDLSKYSILHSDNKQAEEMVQIGFESAVDAIKNFKKKP